MVLLRSVIGQENSHLPLSQPDGKVRPIATSSLALQAVCSLNSHWLMMMTT